MLWSVASLGLTPPTEWLEVMLVAAFEAGLADYGPQVGRAVRSARNAQCAQLWPLRAPASPPPGSRLCGWPQGGCAGGAWGVVCWRPGPDACVPHAPPQELTNLLWALGRLRFTPDAAWMDLFWVACYKQLDRYRCVRGASLSWVACYKQLGRHRRARGAARDWQEQACMCAPALCGGCSPRLLMRVRCLQPAAAGHHAVGGGPGGPRATSQVDGQVLEGVCVASGEPWCGARPRAACAQPGHSCGRVLCQLVGACEPAPPAQRAMALLGVRPQACERVLRVGASAAASGGEQQGEAGAEAFTLQGTSTVLSSLAALEAAPSQVCAVHTLCTRLCEAVGERLDDGRGLCARSLSMQ